MNILSLLEVDSSRDEKPVSPYLIHTNVRDASVWSIRRLNFIFMSKSIIWQYRKKKEKKERECKSKSWKNPRSKKTKTCNHLAGRILKTYWAKLTFEQVFENIS